MVREGSRRVLRSQPRRGGVGVLGPGTVRAREARPLRRTSTPAGGAEEDPLDDEERAAYEVAMTENQPIRAVLDNLKRAGSHPGSMSNRRKCELGERLRAAAGPRDNRFLEDLEEPL